jgi:hypothetical protein
MQQYVIFNALKEYCIPKEEEEVSAKSVKILYKSTETYYVLVRDSSAVRQLFVRLAGAVGHQSALHKETSGFASASAHFHVSANFHVSWLSDFIFYPKPLYKSLHQSFFYSFITILPSESGVTLHYSTILP